MLNEHAGYEADVTITRLADDRYLLVTSAASPVRDKAWIERHLRSGEHVSVVDVSSAYAVLGVMGPASRELLGRLSSADLSTAAFPFATSREISVGYATVRATRLTYVGELGWELFVPTEFAVGVYEDLLGAGGRPRPRRRRVLRHQQPPARQGVSGLRLRPQPGLHAARGGPAVHLQAEDADRFHRPDGARVGHRRGAAAAPRLPPGRRPRPHAVGWRAGAARRRAGRPGHVGGLVLDVRVGGRSGLRLAERTVVPSGRPTWPAAPGRSWPATRQRSTCSSGRSTTPRRPGSGVEPALCSAGRVVPPGRPSRLSVRPVT